MSQIMFQSDADMTIYYFNHIQQDYEQIKQNMFRSDLPFRSTIHPSTRQYFPRSTQTPLPRNFHPFPAEPKPTNSYSHSPSHSNTNSIIRSFNPLKDTLLRSSSHHTSANLLFAANKQLKLFQQSPTTSTLKKSIKQSEAKTSTVNFNLSFKRKQPGNGNVGEGECAESEFVSMSKVKRLNGEIASLRKQVQLLGTQNKQLKEKIKLYECEKQDATNNRNKHVVSLLQDYNNMKGIIQKLIQDNLSLRTQNQKLKQKTQQLNLAKPNSLHISDQAISITRLKQQIITLKKKNSSLEAELTLSNEFKQIIKNKEEEVNHMKINQQSMTMKIKELLDGLKFYHTRFSEQKAELLDDHQNFKSSAISQIARLKRELLEKDRERENGQRSLIDDYNFESDENYIKLITY